MLLFPVEEVVNRPLRVKARKLSDDVLQDETYLSRCSVLVYITVITDLYREEKALGMNCHPSPHEDNVSEYLKVL
jgi:hypothetical protein